MKPSSHGTIIVDGPDNCGKTQIARALSVSLDIPYFRMATQHENWRTGGFLNALRYDQTYLSSFLMQTGVSVIIDRAYPSEFVYSRVFERETDLATMRMVDEQCSLANVVHLICVRRDYSNNVPDDLIPNSKLQSLHDAYVRHGVTGRFRGSEWRWDEPFIQWTKCQCIVLYVDDFGDDVRLQVPLLVSELGRIWSGAGGDITYLMRRSWGRNRLRTKRRNWDLK